MKKTIIFFTLVLLCCACGTIKYVPVESVKTEYKHIATTDSVFLRDSIFVKEKGDTLIIEKYRYLYRDRTLHDSVIVKDTLRIPYPIEKIKEVKAPLSGWQNFQIWYGRIALICALFFVIYFVLRSRR